MELSQLPIRNTIKQPELIRWLLEKKFICIGGYPLYLSGYSSIYSDIDLISTDYTSYYKALIEVAKYGDFVTSGQYSRSYQVGDEIFQIVEPISIGRDPIEQLRHVDFSASGIVLTCEPDFALTTPYANDIINHRSKILYKDPKWFLYRANTHIKKGFELYDE